MVDAGATSPGARDKQLDAQIKSADMVSLHPGLYRATFS